MAGAAPVPSSQARRKSLDAALNLVPFIDLLSCCISFLLITAVWTQLGRIPTAPPQGGVTEGPAPPTPVMTVFVDGDGHTLVRPNGERQVIKRRSDGYDYTALAAALDHARAEVPEHSDLVVRAGDAIEYGDLIRTMDAALAAHFVALRVDGGEGSI